MKYVKALFVLLLVVVLCGCAKDSPAAESTEPSETTEGTAGTLLEIIDDRPNKVLTQKYTLHQLRNVFAGMELVFDHDPNASSWNMTLEDVHNLLPITCLKEDYAIYAVEEGGYYYVQWRAPGVQKTGELLDLSTATLTECWYVPRVCTESDFDSIVMGVSTAADVQAIDPTVRIDYGKDSFGGASSRGHEAYCFAALENGEYFFIGFDGDFGDKTALIATEMEIVRPSFLAWETRRRTGAESGLTIAMILPAFTIFPNPT